MIKPNQIKFVYLLLFILVVAASRIWVNLSASLDPISSFSPIGAMALFGGAYFTRARAFIFPLLALWVSDVFLNKFVFYGEWIFFHTDFLWTYGAFALMVLVGKYFLKEKTVVNVFGSGLLAVIIHWVVTDLGVWMTGTLYPMTFSGWWTCMVMAIPFELNLLIGTLVYSAILFGSVEWLKVRFPQLQTQEA